MTIDQTILVRQALLTATKADPALIALVPAVRHYPQKQPANAAWPFIRVGALSFEPLRLDGGFGSVVSGAIHCFVKKDAAIIDPESRCAAIQSRLAEIVENLSGVTVNTKRLHFYATGGRLMMDPDEADAFHGMVDFEATAI